MAKFNGKTFNAEAFAKYMQAYPNERLNKLKTSKAIAGDERLRELFKNNTQTGTVYATIPYHGRIGGDALNYDGQTSITADTTKTMDQGVFTYGRMKAWKELDFSYDVTGGVDFMSNMRAQIVDYWNDIDQDVFLSILKGVFEMKGATVVAANKKFIDNHTLDISDSKKQVETTDEMKVGATTLNNAIQQAGGDNKNSFKLVIMHSVVATNLENLQLLTYMKYNDANGVERDLGLATWNGRVVIIDDNMPVETKAAGKSGANVNVYTTYVLGEKAISFEEVGAKVPYEVYRDPKNNGGEDMLITRRRNAIAVNGVSYLKAQQSTNSPTNEELANGANWTLINDGTNAINDKFVPLARIISRG